MKIALTVLWATLFCFSLSTNAQTAVEGVNIKKSRNTLQNLLAGNRTNNTLEMKRYIESFSMDCSPEKIKNKQYISCHQYDESGENNWPHIILVLTPKYELASYLLSDHLPNQKNFKNIKCKPNVEGYEMCFLPVLNDKEQTEMYRNFKNMLKSAN